MEGVSRIFYFYSNLSSIVLVRLKLKLKSEGSYVYRRANISNRGGRSAFFESNAWKKFIMSSGVRKLHIGALAPDISNSLIIGVIIAKQGLKIFTSRKDGEERGVWNFTLRDTPVDTINITFWGSAESARNSCETFKVGDVVQVMNARVLFKQPGSPDMNFTPSASSPFQLQLQENSSTLLTYDEEDADEIRMLIFIPTKPPGDYLRLADLLSYGKAMKGDYVNLLVAIRNVGEVRCVKSRKDSRDLMCRDILVMDQSHLEFQITLWSEETIERAKSWRPQQTVIFFADVRLDWSDFKQCVTAVITSRTVITENPRNTEAEALRIYAENFPLQPIAVLDHLSKEVCDPSAINTVMTTAQIVEKAWNGNNLSDNRFTALLFAVITALDLDGSECPVAYKCTICSQFLDKFGNCLNTKCLLIPKSHCISPTPIYDLKVNLTDHRGTLFNCRLLSPTADEVLDCSVQKYLSMPLADKTALKWQLLLTRCEIRLLILCASRERSYPLYSILTCKKANSADVSSKLPIY